MRPDAQRLDATDRYAAVQFWAIEFSAQAIEAAAERLSEVAPGNVDVASLADGFAMASDEVRLQIPAYAAMKARNLARIKAWDKSSTPPALEQWHAIEHAPDGLKPNDAAQLAGSPRMPLERIAMLWNSLPLETDAQSVVTFVRAVEDFHILARDGRSVHA